MPFLCACVHPDPSDEALALGMPPGYWLSNIELSQLSRLAGGIPLTFEHTGINKAVEDVISRGDVLDSKNIRYRLDKLALQNPVHTIIGSITNFWQSAGGAWWATMYIDDVYDAIVWLVKKNHMRGVSLTHIADPKSQSLIPLEVSLCKVPARPRCYVYKMFERPFDALEYMRSLKRGDILDPTKEHSYKMATEEVKAEVIAASEAAAAPTMSRIEEVLQSLAPEHRKLVEDRLVTASTNMEKAIQEMEKTKRLSNITESNLKAQLGVLKAHIDPEVLTNCHIDNEQYLQDLYSDNANDVRRTLDRVLIAANMTLMNYKNQMTQKPAVVVSASNKRARVQEEEPECTPAPNVAEPVKCSDRESALMRAMSDTFAIL